MADFLYFMSLVTGKTGRYPAHYISDPTFVEVDPDDAPCTDCLEPAAVVEAEVEAVIEPEVVLEEVTPTRKRTK